MVTAGSLVQDWQRRWHDLFDAAPQITDPRPDPLPEIDCDFRLHFGLWQLPPDTRAAAVAMLPEGAQLAQRVADWPGCFDQNMPRTQAHALLRLALADLRLCGQGGPHPDAPIVVAHSYPGPLLTCDSPTLDLDDRLWTMAEAKSPEHAAARHFVSETFYRAASDYRIADWLAWPLSAPDGAPDVYAPFARLSHGGWASGWQEDGSVVLVAKRPHT